MVERHPFLAEAVWRISNTVRVCVAIGTGGGLSLLFLINKCLGLCIRRGQENYDKSILGGCQSKLI